MWHGEEEGDDTQSERERESYKDRGGQEGGEERGARWVFLMKEEGKPHGDGRGARRGVSTGDWWHVTVMGPHQGRSCIGEPTGHLPLGPAAPSHIGGGGPYGDLCRRHGGPCACFGLGPYVHLFCHWSSPPSREDWLWVLKKKKE